MVISSMEMRAHAEVNMHTAEVVMTECGLTFVDVSQLGNVLGSDKVWQIREPLDKNSEAWRWLSPPSEARGLLIAYIELAMDGHTLSVVPNTYKFMRDVSLTSPTVVEDLRAAMVWAKERSIMKFAYD